MSCLISAPIRDPLQGVLASLVLFAGLIASIVVGLGLLMLILALVPAWTGRAALAYRRRHLFSALIGLGMAVPGLGLVGAGGPAAVLAIAVYTPLTFLALLSCSEAFGQKIFLVAGREVSRPVHVLVGWPLLAAACCVPFLGQIVILPYALLSGMGSVALGLFSRDEAVV